MHKVLHVQVHPLSINSAEKHYGAGRSEAIIARSKEKERAPSEGKTRPPRSMNNFYF